MTYDELAALTRGMAVPIKEQLALRDARITALESQFSMLLDEVASLRLQIADRETAAAR